MTEPQPFMAPQEVTLEGRTITLTAMNRSHREAVLAFAQAMPAHDLLFLQRDIRNPKVVDAWLEQVSQGWITSLLAIENGQITACTAMVRDEYSWSAHVSEIRILVAPDSRSIGLGRFLALHCLDHAREKGVEKLCVRMTPDQTGAVKLFEEMGFRPEALQRNQLRDSEGQLCDLLIMALDVAQHRARQRLYGMEA